MLFGEYDDKKKIITWGLYMGPHFMKGKTNMEEVERITALVIMLRKYPEVFSWAWKILRGLYPVVDMAGNPILDPATVPGVTYTRAGLHKELDRELDTESYTVRGFLPWLVLHHRLNVVRELIEVEE